MGGGWKEEADVSGWGEGRRKGDVDGRVVFLRLRGGKKGEWGLWWGFAKSVHAV